MSERSFTYSIGNNPSDHGPRARFEFPARLRIDRDDWDVVADLLADDFYRNHDGWECKFPVELRVYVNDACVACFDVEMEFEPSFSAFEKEIPDLAARDQTP